MNKKDKMGWACRDCAATFSDEEYNQLLGAYCPECNGLLVLVAELLEEEAKQSPLIECIQCNQKISRRAQSCPQCGTSQVQQCCICKQTISIHSKTCPECGDPNPFETLTEDNGLLECISCGHRMSFRAERCLKCSATPEAKCWVCESTISAWAKSCPKCGDPDPFNRKVRERDGVSSVEDTGRKEIYHAQDSVREQPRSISGSDYYRTDSKVDNQVQTSLNKEKISGEKRGMPKSCYWMGAMFMTFGSAIGKAINSNLSMQAKAEIRTQKLFHGIDGVASIDRLAKEAGRIVGITTVVSMVTGLCIGVGLAFLIDRNVASRKARIGAYIATSIVGFFLFALIRSFAINA